MIDHHLTTLDNGLRVASAQLSGVETVALAVSVATGSRHEEESESGISHLLEHMAFKGTQTRSARVIAEAFDDIGGQFNAYTSVESTVYHAKVLKEHVGVAMDILSDILLNSVFDEAELSREQGVILQEIAMHEDTPDEKVMDYLDDVTFPGQPLGRSILGTPESVRSHTRETLFSYMGKHYTPGNMVVSAAGNLTHAAFTQLAEKHFAGLKPGASRPAAAAGAYSGGDKRVQDDLEQLHLLLSLPGVSVHHEDYYALALMSSILGGGMSSRLFQEIREKRGLAYHVSSSVTGYSDCGLLTLYAATGAEHVHEIPLLLADEICRMTENVSEAELSRARNQQRADLLMLVESPGRVANYLGRHLLTYGRVKPLEEILKRVEAITPADIQRMAAYAMRAGKPAMAALGPVAALADYETVAARLCGSRLAA